ncbi:MAG: aconitase X catalytic domain-containing protein [Infirmifilum sp.]
MYLDPEEEKMLNGEFGEALALAMKSVVRVAEALGAERLVRIKNAHVSGISYKNIGDEGLEFLEELARKGARVSVPTTMNPAGFDTGNWMFMGIDSDFYKKQMRIIEALSALGVKPTLTCTPYLYGDIHYGDHLAWSESNAVLYANSVIGARTNRDGGPLALFEAVVGRAPLAGLHLEANRIPQLVIDFSDIGRTIEAESAYSAAGLLVGSLSGEKVPLVRGLELTPGRTSEIKLFLAAAGASGGTGLVLIENVSPEKPQVVGVETVKVDAGMLREVREAYLGGGEATVVLGCPHLSIEEIIDILRLVNERGAAKHKVFLYTSRTVYESVRGVIPKLKEKNVHVFADTCMVVSPLSRYAGTSIVTDSGKAAFYLKAQGYDVTLMPRQRALDYAFGGEA